MWTDNSASGIRVFADQRVAPTSQLGDPAESFSNHCQVSRYSDVGIAVVAGCQLDVPPILESNSRTRQVMKILCKC